MQAGVAAAVASVVGAPIADDQPLMEAGIDSLGAALSLTCSTVSRMLTSAPHALQGAAPASAHSLARHTQPASHAGAVELRNSLANQFGVELPQTVTFDYPTVPALARYIAAHMPAGAAGLGAVAAEAPAAPSAAPAAAAAVDVADVRCTACLHLAVRQKPRSRRASSVCLSSSRRGTRQQPTLQAGAGLK